MGAGLVAATLAVANVVNNRALPDRDGPYVASCLATAGVLVALARREGQTWDDLGLAPGRAARGARWGLVAAGTVVAVAAAAAAATPAGRAALRDERAATLGPAGAARAALVRVPLGTVALEEVAFRSVLPAVLAARLGRRSAGAVTAAAFGAWHVLPSTRLHVDNQAMGRVTGSGRPAAATAVALAVGATAVAHLGFAGLRDRSGSVVAPALVHWAINGAGYLASAWAAGRHPAHPVGPPGPAPAT